MKIILLNKQTLHLGLIFFLITGIPTKLQFAVAVWFQMVLEHLMLWHPL